MGRDEVQVAPFVISQKTQVHGGHTHDEIGLHADIVRFGMGIPHGFHHVDFRAPHGGVFPAPVSYVGS